VRVSRTGTLPLDLGRFKFAAMKHAKSRLSHLLAKGHSPTLSNADSKKKLGPLELKMLRIQQGIWHSRKRVIVIFEGPDAAGKGGAIRRLTRALDPRGVRVHPIGPPAPIDQKKHYLYRFWKALPAPGSIAIFDRSWYGRVLVERVKKLTPPKRLDEAYTEINHFEKMLVHDGIDLVKIYLSIHSEEQLNRFEERLLDPYKQWKLTDDDIEAHREWDKYVAAADRAFFETDTKTAPWTLVPADDKDYARVKVMEIVTDALEHHCDWMESTAAKTALEEQRKALKRLKDSIRVNS